jgi:hypothetical protein
VFAAASFYAAFRPLFRLDRCWSAGYTFLNEWSGTTDCNALDSLNYFVPLTRRFLTHGTSLNQKR